MNLHNLFQTAGASNTGRTGNPVRFSLRFLCERLDATQQTFGNLRAFVELPETGQVFDAGLSVKIPEEPSGNYEICLTCPAEFRMQAQGSVEVLYAGGRFHIRLAAASSYFHVCILPFLPVFSEAQEPEQTAAQQHDFVAWRKALDYELASLRSVIFEESWKLLWDAMLHNGMGSDIGVVFDARQLVMQNQETAISTVMEFMSERLGPAKFSVLEDYIQHCAAALRFNPRSPTHIRRWFFSCKKLEPLFSVARNHPRIPSLPWAEACEVCAKHFVAACPSVGLPTQEFYAQNDPVVAQLYAYTSHWRSFLVAGGTKASSAPLSEAVEAIRQAFGTPAGMAVYDAVAGAVGDPAIAEFLRKAQSQGNDEAQ